MSYRNKGKGHIHTHDNDDDDDEENKKALLSQRRPRDAPNIWVP